jgi:hypothetical protein
MKRLLSKLGMIIIFCTLPLIYGCPPEEHRDFLIVDISQETEWDYWVVSKDGSSLFIMENNSKPSVVFYRPDPKQEGYPIYFDDKGFPSKAVIQNHIFFFGNYNGKLVDVSVVLPNGSIKVFREIESVINWDVLYLKSASAKTSDWMKWVGNAIGGVSCVVGLVGALPTGGISLTLTAIGCGSTVVSVLTEFLPKDFEIFGISADVIGGVAGTAGCFVPGSEAVGCMLDLAGSAFTLFGYGLETIEDKGEAAKLAEGIVTSGNGDIKVTLAWDTGADLDLHVVDPSGEEIWWDDPSAKSGGFLDVDDIDGYGRENIFWEDGTAPSGTYRVYVHYYDWKESWRPASSKFKVYINVFKKEYFFEGTVKIDENKFITSFDKNGLKSGEIFEFQISKNRKNL